MNLKLRPTLLLVCLTSSFLLGCPGALRADEPVYENRTLTSWMEELGSSPSCLDGMGIDKIRLMEEKKRAAEQAIRAMGTEAVPPLLNRLTASFGTPHPDEGQRIIGAFRALGAQARPAIPDLIKLLTPAYEAAHRSLSESDAQLKESQAIAAATVLRIIGEAAIDPLLAALRSKDPQTRFGAAMALENFGRYGTDVLPDLINALEDENKNVRWRAARTIGDLRQMPEISVPALARRVSDDPAVNVRLYAISALNKFGGDAIAALPQLSRAANDADAYVGSEAKEVLGKVKAAADQRVADQRVADQRVADQRVADQRVADQRSADQRSADQKAAGN
jgi:hypothetical protein